MKCDVEACNIAIAPYNFFFLQSLYEGMDDVKKNKADRTQVEVEVREVSYTTAFAILLHRLCAASSESRQKGIGREGQ